MWGVGLLVGGSLGLAGAVASAAPGAADAAALAAGLRETGNVAEARDCVLERRFDGGAAVEEMDLARIDPDRVRYEQTRHALRVPGAVEGARPTLVTQHVVSLETRPGLDGAFVLRRGGQTVLSRQSQIVLDSRLGGATPGAAEAASLSERGGRLSALFVAAARSCGVR